MSSPTLPPIRDETHYARMTEMLEALLDETQGDENHPAMGLVASRQSRLEQNAQLGWNITASICH